MKRLLFFLGLPAIAALIVYIALSRPESVSGYVAGVSFAAKTISIINDSGKPIDLELDVHTKLLNQEGDVIPLSKFTPNSKVAAKGKIISKTLMVPNEITLQQ